MRGIWRTRRAVLVVGTLIALGIAPAVLAGPIVIRFEALNLPDVVPGQDHWQYRYAVSGYTFDVDHGFSVYFDPALYANLDDPPAVNADWDSIAVQPDPALPSEGFFDALALTSGASLADPFVVAFTWLGSGGTAPGSQPFTVNQFDAFGELSILETGRTVPADSIPAPPPLILIAMGLAALARRRRQRHTS